VASRFVVWLGIFTPMAFLFAWLPLGSRLEAAALGVAAGVALAVAALVAGRHTPSRSEVSERR
jgi:hypothetical protein